tara:strand:+ start:643 stop:1101 length:459 start_codon:yes stop_codon:yes gene_type:complete
MKREWLDNPFWENPEKTVMKAILKTTDDQDRVTHQVMTIQKTAPNDPEDINPDWIEIMDQIGLDKIDSNTEERATILLKEQELKELQEENKKKSEKLSELFNIKLEAFDIEEVKNSTNKELKTRLRRAKSKVEVNVYAMMIIMEAIQNESKE